MIRTPIVFLMLSVILLPLRANQTVEKLFALEEGNIAYYKSESINTADYEQALHIKQNIESQNKRLYAILIADIFPTEGNELIVVQNNGRNTFSIHNATGEKRYEYSTSFHPLHSKSAVELKEYHDEYGPMYALRFYVLYNTEGVRSIDLFLFEIRRTRVTEVTEVKFYREYAYANGQVYVSLENTFADVNRDGRLDLIVAEREEGAIAEPKTQYQLYRYDERNRRYNFEMFDIGAEGRSDYGAYFKHN